MSLGDRIEAVRAAEADVVLAHQGLLGHLQCMRQGREALVTPGRIIGTGLAVGFVVGRAAPALRDAQFRHEVEQGTDLLQRLIRLASTAIPLLMPLVMRAQQGSDDNDSHDEASAGYG
jgi:hypothetical protein